MTEERLSALSLLMIAGFLAQDVIDRLIKHFLVEEEEALKTNTVDLRRYNYKFEYDTAS